MVSRRALRASLLVLGLMGSACAGDSPPAKCPPCAPPFECDERAGACVGFRTPLLDPAAPDAAADAR
jgi:hypothetical protein